MLFFKSKTLSHRETASIGFVLALFSILFTGIFSSFAFWFSGWMNAQGVYRMDLFLIAAFLTIYLAVQGFLLFGFPLYYAQDKKSHMTGFQILVYSLLWSLLLTVLLSLLMIPLNEQLSFTVQEVVPIEYQPGM